VEGALADHDTGRLDVDFEILTKDEDDSAARAMLAAGIPIHIVRDDTPQGCVLRVHPDGREEVVRVDRDAAAKILGF
jgi:hypothetical protein